MVVAIVARKKKGGKKLLSLFLCFALTGTMFSGISTSVNAADIETETISISHIIKIDNTELQLEATVKYDKLSTSDDQEQDDEVETDVGEISFREPTDDHIVYDDTTGNYFVDNEILVTGNVDASREDIEQVINNIGGTIVGSIEITNDYQVQLSSPMSISELEDVVNQLNQNQLIDNAFLHYLYEIETEIVQDSLKNFALNNGRLEDLTIKSCKTIINLAKNPTGANVSLRLLNEDPENKDLLFVLNDNIADGFDVSWIWDINFNNLKNVERIITAGTRAYDIAIRIKTSGFDENKIYPYLNLTEATEKLYETTNKKYVIANYTALQPTRKEILKLK